MFGCKQVLACAPSNIAVDNIVERLAKEKIKVNKYNYVINAQIPSSWGIEGLGVSFESERAC